jgi:hypothetical protein
VGGVIRARAARRPLGPALLAWLLPPAMLALAPVTGYPQVRAAYCYDYMPVDHVDSLAGRGFNRAVVHLIPPALDAEERGRLRAWVRRGALFGVEVVPQWLFQSRQRMLELRTSRRYAWQGGTPDPALPCPLDAAYWRDALMARTAEAMDAEPSTRSVALDLELYDGGRKYYDAGPCRCAECIREYVRAGGSASSLGGRDGGLARFQEQRLERQLSTLLRAMRTRWPRLEVGVFDLDLDSFVHRALARALTRSGLRAIDYSEASYSMGGIPLERVAARLRTAGAGAIPVVGGLWLQRFAPDDVGPALQSILARADGYFAFTTYSLWQESAKLAGPYTLPGAVADYWKAFAEVNRRP